MRILSQDGLHEGIIDIPYDQVSIEQKKNEIWCGYSSAIEKYCTGKCFAKYSTEAKARKAMEMLHKEYQFEKQFETICNGTTDYPSKPVYYFQFPSDNEVEASECCHIAIGEN